MNNIILRGRLTDAPNTRISPENNTPITRFSLAVPDKTHRNHNGDFDVDFIKIVAFNGLANTVSQYTGKGSEILVTGRLHTYSYEKDNRKVYMSEVIAERIEFVDKCNKPEFDIPETDDELPFK